MNDTFDRLTIKAYARDLLRTDRAAYVIPYLVVTVITLVLSSIYMGWLVVVLETALAFFFLGAWRGQMTTVAEMFNDLLNNNFLRKLGGMLWMMLKVFLWTFVFIIPGFIKAYAYSMTAYVLTDCPNVGAMDASRISEKITNGHKVELFLLDLSFLGWILLGALTFGVLTVCHVGPYIQLTRAGVYEELKKIAQENNVVTMEELDGMTASGEWV